MDASNTRTAAKAAEHLSKTTGLSWRAYDWAPCQVMSRIPERDIHLEITVGLTSGIHAWHARRTINEGLHSADLAGNENNLDRAAEEAIAASAILQAQTREAAGLVWYPTRTQHGWGEPGFITAIAPNASAVVNVWYERWEWRLDLPRPLYDALEATGVVAEICSPHGCEDTFEQAVAAALSAPAILADRLRGLAQAFATAVATLPCAIPEVDETVIIEEPQASTLHGPVPRSEMSACFQVLRRSPGLRAIVIERARQIETEGYTADHDAEHGGLQLLQAAAAYTWTAVGWPAATARQNHWPWRVDEFKPTTALRDATKAGALVAAALDVMLVPCDPGEA